MIATLIRDLSGSGSGEAVHVSDWLETLVENASVDGQLDLDAVISSLQELIAEASSAIKELREIVDER